MFHGPSLSQLVCMWRLLSTWLCARVLPRPLKRGQLRAHARACHSGLVAVESGTATAVVAVPLPTPLITIQLKSHSIVKQAHSLIVFPSASKIPICYQIPKVLQTSRYITVHYTAWGPQKPHNGHNQSDWSNARYCTSQSDMYVPILGPTTTYTSSIVT